MRPIIQLQQDRKGSQSTSKITKMNHILGWDGTVNLDREGVVKSRKVKESVHIMMIANNTNRDEGS